MQQQQFLAIHPFLVSLIEEAHNQIKRYFPQSDMRLAIEEDPECGERQAVLYIVIAMQPDEAVEALNRFDHEWWLERLDQAKGQLCITLEFV